MAIDNRFMGYCPFCGKPMLFLEEHTKTVRSCPVCEAPITFREFIDLEKDKLGYEILPDFRGESFARDGYTVENGVLVGYDGTADEIVTPKGAVAIAPAVFQGNKRIKSVVISDDVQYVGKEAFCECEGIRSLSISKNIKAIGNSAFSHCRRLERVTVPAGLRAAGYALFHFCENLTEVLMPMDMRHLGGCPYSFCKKLRVANIPNCVTHVDCVWFQCNDKLEVLTVGRSVDVLFCPSECLRELYFADPEGWYFAAPFPNRREKPVPKATLASPKAAATLLRKLSREHTSISRPDAESESYWLEL